VRLHQLETSKLVLLLAVSHTHDEFPLGDHHSLFAALIFIFSSCLPVEKIFTTCCVFLRIQRAHLYEINKEFDVCMKFLS